VLAVVYRDGGPWHIVRYFGPSDDEYDKDTRDRRDAAERVALAHAQVLTDAL